MSIVDSEKQDLLFCSSVPHLLWCRMNDMGGGLYQWEKP